MSELSRFVRLLFTSKVAWQYTWKSNAEKVKSDQLSDNSWILVAYPSVIRTRGKAYIEWNVALAFVFENGIPSDDHVINPETEQFPMLQLVTTKITSQSWRKPWIVIYHQGGCQRLLKMTCFLPRGKRTNRAVVCQFIILLSYCSILWSKRFDSELFSNTVKRRFG